MVHFILYSRSYCHLCDDMLQSLQKLSSDYTFTVEVVDVDADEELIAQYDELVPVLVGHKNGMEGNVIAEQLCHYFLDEHNVREFLASIQ